MSDLDQKPSQAGPVPRKTQRAPVSCAQCAARKVKCDKVFPCKRCISKGMAEQCKREIVVVKGRVVGGEGDDVPRREFTTADYEAENKALRKMIRRLTGKLPTREDLHEAALSTPTLPTVALPSPSLATTQLDVDNAILASDLTAIGIENPDAARPMKRSRQASPDVSYLVPASGSVTRSARLQYLLSLVPVDQSHSLVDLSLRLVGWIHGVLHRIPFLEQHDKWLAVVQTGDYNEVSFEWLAVYFAVIATGAYFLGEAWDRQRVFTPQQRLELPRAWFSAALEALYLSEFMTRHTFESLQAICILTLVAHNFGASSHLVSLMHMGLHIAQSRGLHTLAAEEEGKVPPPGLHKRELGRTVWGALELGVAMSPALQQPYALFLPQGFSAPQGHLDEEELVEGQPFKPQPYNVLTRQSVHVALNLMGRLCRRFNRDFWGAPSLEAQWKVVEAADNEFQALVDMFPQLKPSQEPYPLFVDLDGEIPLAPWVRHHFAIGMPKIRMTLHRCFLRKSYSDRTYLKSRQICLESARAILAERQRVVPALFDRAWHITSDTVAAGIILCAIYREETNPAEKRQLYEDVNGCIHVLAKGGSTDNNLVQIGINLLNNFLKSAGSPPPPPPAASSAVGPSSPALPPPPSITTVVPPFHPPIHPSIPVFDPSPPSFPSLDPTFSSLPSPPPPSLPHPSGLPLPTPPADAGEFALPDLWSSLDFSGEHHARGGFDPFGGWEGAVEFDPSWADAGAAGVGAWMPGLAGEGAAEYDPSKPAALW